MTHRIEPFNFWIRLTELNLPFFFTQRNDLFLISLTELNPFILSKIELEELNFYFWKSLKELNLFLSWLKEMNFFPVWLTERNFFFNTTHRNGLIPWIWRKELDSYFLNMTQRIGLFFKWLKELNFFFQFRLTELNLFLNMTHVIEPFFLKKMTLRLEPIFFLKMTQRIEPFSDTT